MATYEEMKKQFEDTSQTLVFKCIGTSANERKAFTKDLEDRQKNPELIDQGKSQLCGAAAFMYCIARESPDEYGKFVLGLAMHGKGSIGSLTCSPPNAPNVVDDVGSLIKPVDWVALAGIRDDGTSSKMDSVKTGIGGMTLAPALRGWFDKTGMFSTRNETYPIPSASSPLDELLKVNTLPAGYVCLLTKGRMVKPGNPSLWEGADHWVVMADASSNNNKVRIQTKSGLQIPTPLGSEHVTQYPDAAPSIDPIKRKTREELEEGTLDFLVYTWKDILRIDQYHGFHLLVKKFLGDFFGFVFAKRK